MKLQFVLVLGLVLCGALAPALAQDADADVPDDFEEPEVDDSRAILIAHKRIKESAVIQGQNLTTIITLVNVGRGAATNVKIKDVVLDPKVYKLISGTTSRVIEAVPSGQTREIEYTYVPQAGNLNFVATPASISYSPIYGQGHLTQTLLSTTPQVIVMTRIQAFKKTLLKMGRYASLGALKTEDDWVHSLLLIAAGTALVGGLAGYSLITKSRAESLRSSAAKALGAEQ